MKQIITSLAAAALLSCQTDLSDESPTYSLDSLEYHPYRVPSIHGNAAQNPGSPKYFIPGYGYHPTDSEQLRHRFDTLNTFRTFYPYGIRQPPNFRQPGYRYQTNSHGGPWFHPGWPANMQTRSFSW